MARATDCLQVLVIVRAALSLRQDVIDFGRNGHATCPLADLTQAAVTTQDVIAALRPCVAVATLVTVAAHCIRLPLDLFTGMRRAVRLATSNKSAAPAMLARSQRPARHFYLT